MGLTTISDINILYQQIVDLQEALEEKIAASNARIKELETTVYKHLVLSLEDKNWFVVRKKRNYLLKISDWTMTAGCTTNQHDWAVYRQQLRDLPQTYQSEKLEDIQWPEMPSPLGPNTTAEDLHEPTPEPKLEPETEVLEDVEAVEQDEEPVTVEESHTAPSSASSEVFSAEVTSAEADPAESSSAEASPAFTEVTSADATPVVNPEVESTEETPTNTEISEEK